MVVKPSGDYGQGDGGLLEFPAFLSKVIRTELLTLTPTELQCRTGAQDVPKGTEMSGFGARAGGAALSHTEMLAETTGPCLSPPPTETAGRHCI